MTRILFVLVISFAPISHFQSLAQNSVQLRKILQEIEKEEQESSLQVLTHQLDAVRLDKEDLPAKDSETGAINIEGETPRSKMVSDFVGKLDVFSKKLREAQELQDQAFMKLIYSADSYFEVIIDFSPGVAQSRAFPLQIDSSIDQMPGPRIEFAPFGNIYHGSASDSPENAKRTYKFLHTVLPKGKHLVRLSGIFYRSAADSATGHNGTLLSMAARDQFSIDQIVEIDTGSVRIDSPLRFTYRVAHSEQGPFLEQVPKGTHEQ